ncbi:MAG TPA: tRNA uridine(34) 5-carboxymethylaminomethyl modification radical SAM/GNAT enzyme Elp3 [Candidatus Nanoarchaeia archaeon]|nr:tRNA uridine(34) 5-carboxymethylaminomethyl modification radical SAM/GNAT enzyme Elp3 [Candidatus Nanoarchaeia archaeon]
MELEFFTRILEEIKAQKPSKHSLQSLKTKISKECGMKRIPTDIEILLHAPDAEAEFFTKYLSSKQTRTLSGVTPVAVMTEPSFCPHGKCTMCPGGPGSVFGDVPMSYTGHEPATMRGMRAGYDSYIQVFNRLEQYVLLGQPVDKVDLIIMGGTFPATSKQYQDAFVIGCFKAMNDFSELFFADGQIDIKKFKSFFELPRNIEDAEQGKRIQEKIRELKATSTLEEEHKRNETARVRCIGLTIETKPDWGLLKHGNEMLRLGCTRVELGVQTVYEEVLKKVNRGHTLQDTKDSIQILRDLGFKLNFHFMLGLPLTDREKDIAALKELFDNPAYRPDMMKIYPCMVSSGTVLFNQMKRGDYQPITTEEAVDRIVEGERYVQRYCRIMRVQRDIPPKFMEAGVDRSNLRQYVDDLAKQKGVVCQCIRCREVGRMVGDDEIIYNNMKYDASQGTEFFISANTKSDALIGFARLRYPSESRRAEISDDSALIRELHVYGTSVPVGEEGTTQHKGIGKELMRLAEEQAKKDGKKKMIVISGVGVREYYRKLGYSLEGPYMVKTL